MRSSVILLLAALVFACGEDAAESAECRCAREGGEWLDAGTWEGCIYFTSDGDRPCTDSNECEAECLAPPGTPPGTEVVGSCSHTTWDTCMQPVRNGVAAAGKCV